MSEIEKNLEAGKVYLGFHTYYDREAVSLLLSEVTRLEERVKELENNQWYLHPKNDIPNSPYKGKGETWIHYAQREFRRAEAAEGRIKAIKRGLRSLKNSTIY